MGHEEGEPLEPPWKKSRVSLPKRDKVMVRIPATAANMGPGFDAIGMAVDIWNEITVKRAERFYITTEGEGVGLIPEDVGENGESKHLVLRALKKAFEYAGEVPMPPVHIKTRNMVPICSGFGSSSSAIVGGLIAGLVLAGKELAVHTDRHPADAIFEGLQPEELLHLATEIEGHPDNVAPAIYGGIQLSMQTHEDVDHGIPRMAVMSRRIPHPPGLRLVAYVPNEKARLGKGLEKTEEMRSLLKPTIERRDAVINIQRTALLIDSLHRGDLKGLRFATRDRLHQPMRADAAYPHLEIMMQAALAAGAHGAFLAGAGPTVMAMCSGQAGDIFTQCSSERQEGAVAEAMKNSLESLPEEQKAIWSNGDFYIVSPAFRGAHVALAEPKFSGGLATFGSLDGPL